MNLTQTILKFQLGWRRKDVTIEVIHNLPDFGLDIEAAFDNWTARTKVFTARSFADYVKSKDVNIICLTKFEYNKIFSKKDQNKF